MIDQEIKKKSLCVGCHACASICPVQCISMKPDNEDFLYPVVDYDKCTHCAQCMTVCPVINRVSVKNEPTAYACISNDGLIREMSSSGGVFSLIAESVIGKGGVIFGAAFDSNFVVQHMFVDTEEDLCKLRGSKYVQSTIGETYIQAKVFLDEGREVLFSGTPCQIAGLRAYLGKEYENLLTIDIICHGVPSPKVWAKYVDYREAKAGVHAQRITFRKKNKGWKQSSVSFSFENETEYCSVLSKDPYMITFLKNICLRPSCYECAFKSISRQSDLTLADFWGVSSIVPEMDDDKGTSLVFIHTDGGRKMFCLISGKMISEAVDIKKAIEFNSSTIKSAESNPKREKYLTELEDLAFDKLVNKYCSDSVSIIIKSKVKSSIRYLLTKTRMLGVAKKFVKR